MFDCAREYRFSRHSIDLIGQYVPSFAAIGGRDEGEEVGVL